MEIRKRVFCTEIFLRADRIGEEYCVQVGGGDKPHIGCTVLAVPRLSLEGNGKVSSTSSVLNVTGHKDEYVCRFVAEEIAKSRNTVTVCTGGIHVDDISREQIQELMITVKEMVKELDEML